MKIRCKITETGIKDLEVEFNAETREEVIEDIQKIREIFYEKGVI